jgi:hypothetical protein
MTNGSMTSGGQTAVGYNAATGALLYGGFGGAGLVVGFLLPQLAFFLARLPWAPFQGPARLISEFDGPWLRVATTALGGIAGLVIAYIAIREMLTAVIADAEVRFEKDGKQRVFARSDIAAVFVDGKQLVVLGTSGHELLRENSDESPARWASAFRKHGYPWSEDGDPYRDQYRRWVPDTPDVPPSVNALLKARERALQKKDRADAGDLRNELAKLGYVVREEGTRQYWRKVPGGEHET